MLWTHPEINDQTKTFSMSYFDKKVVLVTGASTGLGWYLARAFATRGAEVVITARGAERLKEAADALCSEGGAVSAIAADVTVEEQVDRLFVELNERYERLDVLVNNVGRSTRGLASETSPEQFRELFELNFLSLVRCTRAAVPRLIQSRGHLVNIGSLSSKLATPNLGAYPVSKFAVAAYSQQLRLALAPQGVHVLLVCPGPIARDDSGHRYNDDAHDLPAAASRPGGGAKLKAIAPELLASRVVAACQQRRPELVVPGKARWLFAISQRWPSLGDWIVRKMT